MNPTRHSEVSVNKRGGAVSDYLEIHSFIDHTKVLCSDGRHRILHNHWAIHNLVIPIFGHSITNSDGRTVDVKDMCEEDHLLVDYRKRFIPTLSDFVSSIDDNALDSNFAQRVEQFHQQFAITSEISELMLSPLMVTGNLKSLLITHNSWFVNNILPRIHQSSIHITEFTMTPTLLFESMNYQMWMDNGAELPPSAKRLNHKKLKTEAKVCRAST